MSEQDEDEQWLEYFRQQGLLTEGNSQSSGSQLGHVAQSYPNPFSPFIAAQPAPVSFDAHSMLPWDQSLPRSHQGPRSSLISRSLSLPSPRTDPIYTAGSNQQYFQDRNVPGPSASSVSSAQSPERSCTRCNTRETTEWRRHPHTYATLCNACGLYLQTRKRDRPTRLIEGPQRITEPPPHYNGPRCSHCGAIDTPAWRRNKATQELLCNACGMYLRSNGRMKDLNKLPGTRNKRSQSQPGTSRLK